MSIYNFALASLLEMLLLIRFNNLLHFLIFFESDQDEFY